MEENENASNTVSSDDPTACSTSIKSEYGLDLMDYSLIQSFPAQIDDLCGTEHVLSNVEIKECLDSYQDSSEMRGHDSRVEVSSMDSTDNPCGASGERNSENGGEATVSNIVTSLVTTVDSQGYSSRQNASKPAHDDSKAQERPRAESSALSNDVQVTCHPDNNQKCTIDCFIANREFFFENDHPILKNNSDYRKLLYVSLVL